jgi:shikimate dehydrogenase
MRISGATPVAGVVGAPITHSLSPLLHNAWLEAAGLDGVYVAFPIQRLTPFAEGLRGGVIRGLNITAPFKEEALALADTASDTARRAGAANVLTFAADGAIHADNTDGLGLMGAFAEQAPGTDFRAGPSVILGAGGAARGAAAALLEAGAPQVRIVARTLARAEAIAAALGGAVVPVPWSEREAALIGAVAVINATPLGSKAVDEAASPLAFTAGSTSLAAMDMVYRPLRTPFLAAAATAGARTVDGLAMLIGQARPAFAAFFGQAPPAIDIRARALAVLEEG